MMIFTIQPLRHFFLIQLHAPAQEYFVILLVIQISNTMLTLDAKQAIWGTHNKESASRRKVVLIQIVAAPKLKSGLFFFKQYSFGLCNYLTPLAQ